MCIKKGPGRGCVEPFKIGKPQHNPKPRTKRGKRRDSAMWRELKAA